MRRWAWHRKMEARCQPWYFSHMVRITCDLRHLRVRFLLVTRSPSRKPSNTAQFCCIHMGNGGGRGCPAWTILYPNLSQLTSLQQQRSSFKENASSGFRESSDEDLQQWGSASTEEYLCCPLKERRKGGSTTGGYFLDFRSLPSTAVASWDLATGPGDSYPYPGS